MRLIAGLELSVRIGPEASAAIGEVTVGPRTMLAVLETQLGLTAPEVGAAERVAAILDGLGQRAGAWSRSYEVDPWGTAIRVLRDRDALTLQGWTGQPASPRLQALFEATQPAACGLGDRFIAVAEAIERENASGDRGARRVAIESITLVDPELTWPGAIRRVLVALREAGVDVREASPEMAAAPTGSDLAAAKNGPFSPRGDGSLQLVRAQGVLAAAEDLAAWLAEHGDTTATLVISPDATLDGALRRSGLPTLGASSGAGAILQVLPLCLELLWDPPDPQRVLELVTLPGGPIPARLGRALAGALRSWPAVGSDAWADAIAEHDFGDERDPAAAQRRRARVEAIFSPAVARSSDTVAVADVLARIEVLAAWVRGRMHAGETEDADALDDGARRRPAFGAAWAQIGALRSLLAAHEEVEISAARLQRFVDAATEDAGVDVSWPAQAGLSGVSSPASVIRPVETIVWWGFCRDAAPPVRELDLTRAERDALAASGVVIPSAGERALWAAQRWRRPLMLATKALLLVCPQAEAPGERQHPHPLWDEIVAAMPDAGRSRTLITTRPGIGEAAQVSRAGARPWPLPSAVTEWTVPAGALKPRDRESPSALGALVGCSLQWALRYGARLRDDGASWRLSVGPREHGSLAHEIVARVLDAEPADADEAEAMAGSIFDDIGPKHVAELFMPGHDDAREDARLTITSSARALLLWLAKHGLTPELIEGDVARAFGAIEVGGRVDLLVGTPRVVVDLKWGGREKRRREVELGTAYQLATYAYAAAAEGRAMPEYAYFILREQLMVGRRGGPFDENTAVDGPPPSQAWQWFSRACQERLAELSRGEIVAPGAKGEKPGEPTIDGDRLALGAGCEYCSYDGLCGRAFAEDEPQGDA